MLHLKDLWLLSQPLWSSSDPQYVTRLSALQMLSTSNWPLEHHHLLTRLPALRSLIISVPTCHDRDLLYLGSLHALTSLGLVDLRADVDMRVLESLSELRELALLSNYGSRGHAASALHMNGLERLTGLRALRSLRCSSLQTPATELLQLVARPAGAALRRLSCWLLPPPEAAERSLAALRHCTRLHSLELLLRGWGLAAVETLPTQYFVVGFCHTTSLR